MKKAIIGTAGESIDVDILLTTRMLIQADSGNGKSYLIRRLVEQLFGKVQIIVIDPEGEFSTLRENFDFVLVGPGGETPADIRSAPLLATKLLELNASAICDIYEMRTLDRHRWVRMFLEALINAPKKLWHPVVVVVDEAHLYAPEKGQGESEAVGAMMDLASRGRKRGFCLVAATQRLGKLSKNVSSQLQNVLIGGTFQDIDRKRAAETLGVTKADERAFFTDVRLLEPGNFFALGRAISTERIKLKVAGVTTTHPISGKYKSTPPAPSEKIRALLPQLSDLPAAAEEKLKTEKDLRAEIAELKKQVKTVPAPEQKIVEVPMLSRKQVEELRAIASQIVRNTEPIVERINRIIVDSADKVGVAPRHFDDQGKKIFQTSNPSRPDIIVLKGQRTTIKGGSLTIHSPLPIGERKVLEACIQFENGLERNQLTVLTGYKRSSRDAYIARLKEKGYVSTNGKVEATAHGIAALPDAQPLPTGLSLQAYWLNRLPIGEKSILQLLIESYPSPLSRDAMEERTGYKRSSRDAYLARLSAKELVCEAGRGQMIAAEGLF